ncbi:MAG: YbaB/EbfC family nucleoid-associated protein [Planctomycetaceae bacterium]|nr:YbaB/EbfC family nucleoid-associated protein [Planctomycetaceae bacterium]
MFELGSLMKQAQEMSGKLQEMSGKLKELRVSGSSMGGMVTVEMNGMQEMIHCKIDPALIAKGDAELLEELIVSAVNEAVNESRRVSAESMSSLSEGMDMGALGQALNGLMPK